MKKETLYEAIGDIDEKYICEAKDSILLLHYGALSTLKRKKKCLKLPKSLISAYYYV